MPTYAVLCSECFKRMPLIAQEHESLPSQDNVEGMLFGPCKLWCVIKLLLASRDEGRGCQLTLFLTYSFLEIEFFKCLTIILPSLCTYF